MPARKGGMGVHNSVESAEIAYLVHALDSKKGGLVTQCHNEVRDALGDIAALAFKEETREPVVREADEARGISALVADLGVRGVWQLQAEALFDIRVIDTDAQSHAHSSVNVVLATAEKEKRKYTKAAQARHASFFPFVFTVDGLMVQEAHFVVQQIATALSTKWSKSYGVVID